MLSVLYPRITAPELIGPRYASVTYLGAGPFSDFYFICHINYQHLTHLNHSGTGQAMFEVVLTFDSQISSVTKTTTSSSLDVTFTSQDAKLGFGTEV